MSEVLKRLAYLQTRRDRTPNLDLARDLVAQDDKAGIRKIAQNMQNENKNIHSDCIHVMYEIGIIEPRLIEHYSDDFIKLLKSRHSNMVSGAMTALAEIAKVNPEFIFKNLDTIFEFTVVLPQYGYVSYRSAQFVTQHCNIHSVGFQQRIVKH